MLLRKEDEGCCQWHDGNPPSDDFGEHLLQALALGISRCIRCPDTLGQNHPFVCAHVCVMMLPAGLSPAASLGKLRQGIGWQQPPGLGLHRDFWKPGFFSLTLSAAMNSPPHDWLLRSFLAQVLCISNGGRQQKPTQLWGPCRASLTLHWHIPAPCPSVAPQTLTVGWAAGHGLIPGDDG